MKLQDTTEEYNKKYAENVSILLNAIKDLNYEKKTFISNSLHYKEENLEIIIVFCENMIDTLTIRDKNSSSVFYTKSLIINIEQMLATKEIKMISYNLYNKYFI